VAQVAQSGEFVELLHRNEESLMQAWIDAAMAKQAGKVTRAELERQLGELGATLLRIVSAGYEGADNALDDVHRMLTNMSEAQGRQGVTPSETATSVLAVKHVVVALIDAEADHTRLLRDYVRFASFVDELGLYVFEISSRAAANVIAAQAEQLLELSTPVVKIWDGVLVAPLVGTLDSSRAQLVTEQLLQALLETGCEYAIIDITGVPAVDTQVAQHLLKTVMAARLMGGQCIVSGIRPQIAQTIATLDIGFGDITTKASLADALALILRDLGFDVVKRRNE
jgi:rsbT co-antagonist protein RsbR